VASVPHDRAEGVQIPHARALVAVLAYGSAALALVVLAFAARGGDTPGAATEAVAPALSTGGGDLLARRALAARAQRGVYVVEGPNGGRGSGFVAWVQKGRNRSYVITARAVVAGVLADGDSSVYLKRENSFWAGRIVREDSRAGLALIRVDTALARPLWQRQVDHASLERALPATIVPAGPDAPFGEGPVDQGRVGFRLRTGSHGLYLGAPVVSPSGRLAGVVVAVAPREGSRIVSIEQACAKIRRCS
jgi:hypothetical protein